MQIVMGELNGIRLINLMSDAAAGQCTRVTAAVAYATDGTPFFEHCRENKIFLDFYGLLDESAAVSVPVLEKMLRAGPLVVSPRLIKGHFHSKVIWWHGYGAYIGSANLTSNAWYTNVECGVFFPENEIIGHPIEENLNAQFEYLRAVSAPVTDELVRALGKLQSAKSRVLVAQRALSSEFEKLTEGFPPHLGLTAYRQSPRVADFNQFTTEWTQTLQLIRGLSEDFKKLEKRPKWVDADADPTVHFDQFLQAYYHVCIRDDHQDEGNVKSVESVNQAHERNKHNKEAALRAAAEWWAALPSAPHGEDNFIKTISPMMKRRFSHSELRAWSVRDFKEVFSQVHAFRAHARQIKKSTLGLNSADSISRNERSDIVAEWMWNQPREASQKHILELLNFLVWGNTPSNVVERLWRVTHDKVWRYDHLGPSTLGEAIGWARPDLCPPRNNRTNKALKALGHAVLLFSS